MSSTTSRRGQRSDEALRANVRLLGDVLGRVLVEQEGPELLALEEEIRGLARLGRSGDHDAAAGSPTASPG